MRTVSFVPPLISTGNPDIAKIHGAVKKAINSSEGKKSTKKAKAKTTTPVSTTTNGGGSIGNLRQGYAANQAEDLSSVC